MIEAQDFCLRFTVESGQPLAFYSDFERAQNGASSITYPTEKGVIRIFCKERKGNAAEISYDYFGDYTKVSAQKEVMHRLSLNHDVKAIYSAIDTDPFMHSAITELRGMRVTSNPPWETTLSFLVSQFNNIKRIRMIMKRLIENFGEEIEVDGKTFKKFPTYSAIAAADMERLRACNSGFRAKYIKSVANAWKEFDHSRLYDMDYQSAKELLIEFDGVGDKVADCILLMGFGKYEAFPIDVWIKRTLEKVYLKRKRSISYIHRFADRKWDGYAGYANQYIYWFGRNMLV